MVTAATFPSPVLGATAGAQTPRALGAPQNPRGPSAPRKLWEQAHASAWQRVRVKPSPVHSCAHTAITLPVSPMVKCTRAPAASPSLRNSRDSWGIRGPGRVSHPPCRLRASPQPPGLPCLTPPGPRWLRAPAGVLPPFPRRPHLRVQSRDTAAPSGLPQEFQDGRHWLAPASCTRTGQGLRGQEQPASSSSASDLPSGPMAPLCCSVFPPNSCPPEPGTRAGSSQPCGPTKSRQVPPHGTGVDLGPFC